MSSSRNLPGHICGTVVAVVSSLALASCEVESREQRLARAARGMDVVAVERLLAEGADPNSKDANGVTPLLIAAERGDVPSVEALIKRGAAVNSVDALGRTPLMLSAWSFRAVVVDALLRHGADPCLKSGDGRTALAGSLLASTRPDVSAVQRREVIEALGTVDCDNNRRAAKPDATIADASSAPEHQSVDDAETPFCKAVRESDVARTKELLDSGADPRVICTELISRSISSGVISGFERMPALLVAARNEDPTLIGLLVAAGAPVDARDDNGQTALIAAARVAGARVVKALLSMGANANDRDKQGRTPLMVVSDEPSLSATILGGAGLRTEADTALRKTMASGVATVEALLAAGADVNAVDSTGRTALLLARLSGRTHIADALLRANAGTTRVPAPDRARRLAFIAGYLDLYGKALVDLGGKDVGGRHVSRAEMMRNAARRNSSSQEELLRNVDEGIRSAMNDYNSLDARVMALRVLQIEQEGLLLMIRLVEDSSVSPDQSLKTPPP